MSKLRMIGVMFGALILATMALASPAQAATDTTTVTRTFEGVASKGAAGWSCPEGTIVVAGSGEVVGSEGGEISVSQAMGSKTQYPHYKTGENETGWYFVNGETPQDVSLTFRCQEMDIPPHDCEAYTLPSGDDLCSYTPADGDLDCGDLKDEDRPVKVKTPGNDPYKLDRDKDGTGCELDDTEPTPAPTATPTTDPGTDPGAGGGSGEDLPVTGAAAGTIAGGAVLLLIVGAGLFYVARRRKVTFTA